MHGYGRVTTKRQRDRKSVGGRNGDQYATTVKGGEADGGRGAWRSDRGRERAKDGHSLTVQDGRRKGRRRRRTRGGGTERERPDERNPHWRKRKGRATKATEKRDG